MYKLLHYHNLIPFVLEIIEIRCYHRRKTEEQVAG